MKKKGSFTVLVLYLCVKHISDKSKLKFVVLLFSVNFNLMFACSKNKRVMYPNK